MSRKNRRKYPAAAASSAEKTTGSLVVLDKRKSAADKLGKPSVIKMTFEEWVDIPPCHIQRNTEEHWHKKAHKYLAKLCDQHTFAKIAITEDGQKRKLDCHTRTWAWVNGLTDAVPEFIIAEVVYVKDLDEVKAEYRKIDEPAQSKIATDNLFSAFKEFDFQPKSLFLFRCAGIVSALKEAILEVAKLYEVEGMPANARSVDVSTCVKFFKPQLEALDSINPTKKRFSGPPTTAFLLAHFKYTELGYGTDLVIEFCRRHQNNEGVKVGREHDAVYEVEKIMKVGDGAGESIRKDRTARILACVERFVVNNGENITWSRGTKVDMENYLLDEQAALTTHRNRKNSANNKKRGITR